MESVMTNQTITLEQVPQILPGIETVLKLSVSCLLRLSKEELGKKKATESVFNSISPKHTAHFLRF